MRLLNELRSQVRAALAGGARPSILVAVSGGPDSVALLDALARLQRSLGLRLGVAHVDYGLRGEASRGDAEFVTALAARHDLPLYRRELTTSESADLSRRSLQDGARRIRHAFFEATAVQQDFSLIALAHHADDQIETFLLNLVRGAGPGGLKGMRILGPGRLFRPFLRVSRAQILDYLAHRRLDHRQDASNSDERFLRVKVRRQVVGPLLALRPGARASILHAMEILAADASLLDHLARRATGTVVIDGTLDLAVLAPLPLALQRRVVREWLRAALGREPGFELVERVLSIARAGQGGARVRLSRQLAARRSRGRLSIVPES